MGTTERKLKDRAEREQRIIAAARRIAEGEGWSAVTVRRLAEEIAYSQPVLYSHFENRDAIVTAVAVAGFRELTTALRQVARDSTDRRSALRHAAFVYLAFAREHQALYEAMFTMPTRLRFAQADTKSELHDAFAALKAIVAPPGGDAEVATEAFWATLHGLAELERSGRIRREARDERVAIIVSGFLEA